MNITEAIFNSYIDRFPGLVGLGEVERRRMYGDFLRCEAVYMAEPMDYLKYGFYRMDDKERVRYFTRREYADLSSRYNDRNEAACILDKALFIQKFEPFLCRDALVVKSEEREHFLNLYGKCDRLIFKPATGGYGKGIRIFNTGAEASKVWDELAQAGGIVEEVICQHSATASFHPYSVNTVRILSVIDEGGDIHIPAAAFRCGVGDSVTDNAGGLYATIDVDTGTICSDAVTPFGHRHECHPDTRIPFYGFHIPRWEAILEAAKMAAMLIPKVRIINWDWAIDQDRRPVVIEGNLEGGIGPLQLSGGLKGDIYSLLQ